MWYAVGVKKCSKCQQTKPFSAFHKDKQKADGYNFHCKDCRRLHRLVTRLDTERFKTLRRLLIAEARDRGYDWCPYCKTLHPMCEFYSKRANKRMTRCPASNRAHARKKYHTVVKPDPEKYAKLIQSNLRYFQSVEGQAALAKGRILRQTRMEDQFVEAVDRWVVWERDGGVCGICGDDADPSDFHVDHIMPISRGGSHSYDNVQIAHPPCNLSKRDKVPDECRAVA